jgi:hypothetical protein
MRNPTILFIWAAALAGFTYSGLELLRVQPTYDPYSLGYIDDDHGNPGTHLHLKAIGCSGFGGLGYWEPRNDGSCHLEDALKGHKMTPIELADSPAPQADFELARRWCAAAIAEDDKRHDGRHVDGVQLHGRDFICNPFHQD